MGKRQLTDANTEMTKMLKLAYKVFLNAMIKMFQRTRKKNEKVESLSKVNKILSKDIEDIKKNQM